MLFESTVEPKTLKLLKNLQSLTGLEDFALVGGTSLALQIGHRISIDLDLFTPNNFHINSIPTIINHLGKVEIVNQTKSILNLFIDDIKVDFVSYKYMLLKDLITINNIRLVSIEDITAMKLAAMKLAAITGRGSRKDFVDLYFILKQFNLLEVFKFYNEKYLDGSEFLVFKSLTYFTDAELEPMPKMLMPVDWEEIKLEITKQVRMHFP